MSSLHWRAAAPLAVVAGLAAPFAALAAPFAALAAPLAAQEPRLQTLPVDPLVEVEWLLRHIADDDVVVVEAERRPGEFAEEHIAGARPLRFQDITWDGEEGWIVEFPEVDEIVAVLRAAGIQRDSRVVIYGTSMTATARTWATFDFLGLGDRAFLLDGGIADWKAAGGAVESGEAPPVEPGDVVARSPVDFTASRRTGCTSGSATPRSRCSTRAPTTSTPATTAASATGATPAIFPARPSSTGRS